MSTSRQIGISLFLVAAATSVVFYQLRSAPGEGGGAAEGEHDMAAMLAGGGEMQPVVLDAEASQRIGVAFATVERRVLPAVVRTVGNVVYDETRLTTVSPKVDGWVEELVVDFTGAPVQMGEPLLRLYSPALVTAQEELVLAVRLVRNASADRARQNAEEMLASSRRRLAYWDVPVDEIQRIEESGEPTKTVTLLAPATGIIVEKNVVEGDRIMPGMTVFRIADLTRVWIEAEVFEKDLALVSLGQRATVTFPAYPGESFVGGVTYVHPTVSSQSRTARVRLELSNSHGLFMPGMYAQVEFQALAAPPTLVVPRSSVLVTGERALVFVQASDGALHPREVVPGRTAGQLMEILSGLAAGERIVSSAAFLVDAESNLGTLRGVPGSMPDTSDVDHSGH
ncbi:MAG: efflux RND transporter periplasmic adaptor subunit [Gemmatimonadetes bacterium]|nr:efflux RND transporter periplasmic adaptor subunit [Gemmatimonadota bacterium]MDA1102409.1 efflux RND transporter periplasmic adaptor subunit [Gemmatimonadota bacterium]